MSLKCHSCGNEYHYDMKICPNCEEDAINSGLISLDGLRNNWRCDVFLDLNSITFGTKNILENDLDSTESFCNEVPNIAKNNVVENNVHKWNSASTLRFNHIHTEEKKIENPLIYE